MAQLGSLVHLVMQHLDFSRVGEAEIERQIASLVEKGFDGRGGRSLIPVLLPVSGGLRIAPLREAVRREQPFTWLTGGRSYPELSGRMGGRDPYSFKNYRLSLRKRMEWFS